jgi:hypothetical protein
MRDNIPTDGPANTAIVVFESDGVIAEVLKSSRDEGDCSLWQIYSVRASSLPDTGPVATFFWETVVSDLKLNGTLIINDIW